MKHFILLTGIILFSGIVFAQDKLIAEKSGKGAVLVHEVQPKEGLYSLSRDYGVKVNEIASANGFAADKNLIIGEKVKIPLTSQNLTEKSNKKPVYYTVSDGDNLSSISNRFNKVSLKELKKWNKINNDVAPNGKEMIVGYFTGSVPAKAENSTTNKASAKTANTQLAVIKGSNINIRKGPATNEAVIGTAQEGSSVTVIKKINNDWTAIRTGDGTEGYIASQFLDITNTKKEVKKPAEQTAKIYGNNINIRKGPSTSDEVVGNAQDGDVVTITKKVNNDWMAIRTGDGKEGYVASQFFNPPTVKEEPKKAPTQTAKIYGTNINVRKGPSTENDVVATAQDGDMVTVIRKADNEWTAIKLSDGTEGYIASQFLNPPDPKNQVKKVAEQTGKIYGTNINVRKGPSTDEAIVGTTRQNEVVTITKKLNNEWTAIRLADGTEGYIASRFLTPRDNIETVAEDNKSDVAKNEKIDDVVDKVETKIADKESNINAGYGFFKESYHTGNNTERTVTSGIFKTDRGWDDEKYYLLTDKANAGAIVKITNPENNKTIYAKVLGAMSGVEYSDDFDIRISDAAANQLQTNNTDKFIVKVAY